MSVASSLGVNGAPLLFLPVLLIPAILKSSVLMNCLLNCKDLAGSDVPNLLALSILSILTSVAACLCLSLNRAPLSPLSINLPISNSCAVACFINSPYFKTNPACSCELNDLVIVLSFNTSSAISNALKSSWLALASAIVSTLD